MDALARGVTLVAASPRAARAARLLHARAQSAAGHSVWPSPLVFDWNSWLRLLWHNHAFASADSPLLLSPVQERALWTRVQRGDAALVLSPDSLASLAMEAWSLLSAWQAHPARRLSWEPADAERFRHWTFEFDRLCATHNWISASQLEARLCAAPADSLELPREIFLLGFDRFTPAQAALLDFMRAHGVAIVEQPSPSGRAHPSLVVAAGPAEEVAACAAWARRILLEQPSARIAVIAPSIDAARGPLERAFRRALLPSADDIRRPSAAPPFEFSLGQPLAHVPALRAALLLLRWIAAPLPDEDVSWLLLSGFLGQDAIRNLDLALRDAARRDSGILVPRLSLAALSAALERTPSLRPLARRMLDLLQAVDANRVCEQPRPPSAWAELIHLLLDLSGWPGERPSGSLQFQALQRWHRLLDELALLDFDGSSLPFTGFVDLLDLHARETIFAPESSDAPVQIMGPLESAGRHFDAIWFLSSDEAHWPALGRPHPLLPLALQRQHGMPHSSPQEDWSLARTVTLRLLGSAPHMIFSYAQRDEDAELRPSPLLADLFPPDAQPQSAASLFPAESPHLAPALESIPDAPAELPWPRERHAGGADLLRRQAACPFQAFATKRLAAEPLESPEWGLSPAERGALLHQVLERLFSQSFPTHGHLVAALASGEASALLDAHIDAVFRSLDPPSGGWEAAYLDAEKRRLRTRLDEWLACEARRQPFTVEATEQKLPGVRIGDLLLDLRADRIDRLDDGSRLIIDYKTGRISPAVWLGERPDEPQLPLYAVCGSVENLSGILFAKIRAGETGFEGRIRDARAQLLAGLSPRTRLVSDPFTPAMREQWAAALRGLAQEFLDGQSAVSPREPELCRTCPLPALCRRAELTLAAAADEEENPDA